MNDPRAVTVIVFVQWHQIKLKNKYLKTNMLTVQGSPESDLNEFGTEL